MDRSIDRNINQLHPSKILDEMGISWNDNLETKTEEDNLETKTDEDNLKN